jgi:hypothetical protein
MPPPGEIPIATSNLGGPVSSLPTEPLGIVIKSGAPKPKPVRFWAYLWAADEESVEDHWHQRIPSEHAA